MTASLTGIIGSKTKIQILLRLFFNPDTKSYLRELAREFNVSSNAVRQELNQLTKTNLLTSIKNGRQVSYMANTVHPLFPEIQSMVNKVFGMDQVIDGIVRRLGKLKRVYLIGDYAEGKDTGIIDLVMVGYIDRNNLEDLTKKTERYIERNIRTIILTEEEFSAFLPKLQKRPHILFWEEKAGGNP